MSKYTIKLVFVALLSFSWACNNTQQTTEDQTDAATDTAAETEYDQKSVEMSALPPDTAKARTLSSAAGDIRLTEVKGSPEYLDAMLEMNAPGFDARLGKGKVTFEFDVKNFALGKQTLDASSKGIANSGDGQHIHLILNNEPYSALYEVKHTAELKEGRYTVLAFLSRSYHESVKNPEAYVLRQFTVGSAQGNPIDVTAPHLFYSRPKGEYKGRDTENILLDFYLVNINLSDDGYKVKATINGEDFVITKWTPYLINGLPAGENTIRLELLDAQDKTVASPFNPVERKITVVKQAS